jgi:NAD+ diphosphatase
MKYCQECGAALIDKELEHEGIVPFCPNCQDYRFPMYNVAVSMIIINEENRKTLLVKQYGKDFFRLVAGYVNRTESLEHATMRELKEETGMTAERIVFNRTQFFEPSNTLMCNFTVFVKDDHELNPNYEIDSCEWFSFDDARKNIDPKILAGIFLNAYLDDVQKCRKDSVSE